jgi:hypothetical protein
VFVGVARAEGIRAYHYNLVSFTFIAEQQKRGWRPIRDHKITFDDAPLAIDEDKGTAIPFVDASADKYTKNKNLLMLIFLD